MTNILKFDELLLDLNSYRCFIGESEISLRNKEFFLLHYFLINIGKVISRTEILEEVWDRNICCATNTVDVHISKLRKKLRKITKRCFIRTVPCIGYILG